MKALQREILLSFWKVHILHHAGEEPLCGQWMLMELRRHGYEISPGTLYPLLRRLEAQGLLTSEWREEGGRNKRFYRLSTDGRQMLKQLLAEWNGINKSLDRIV